jgi:autotransporter-associated beta strand protein
MTINANGFNSTFSGNFGGTGGITVTGTGAVTLTGISGYTGPTSVTSGTLALTTPSAHTASLGNTAISVASGATFAATLAASPFSKMISAGTAGSGTAGATLTLEPGSAFSMAGGSLATFNLRQEASFSGTAFTIGGASGNAPTLTFGNCNAASGTDLIDVTKTVSVLATGGDITIDPLAGDTSLTTGNYDLIVSTGGFSGTGGNGLTLTDTTLEVADTTYDLSLANSTADDEVLTVSLGQNGPLAPRDSFAYDGQPRADLLAGRTPLVTTAAVPEPSTTMSLLVACGAAALLSGRRPRSFRRSKAG